jgi:lipopolysaccharide export system permease protein
MRAPLTLSFYIGRQFVLAVLSTLLLMLLIVDLMELLDLVRRAASTARGVPFITIVEMALLKLPTTAEKIYPFAFLIGGMVTLSRLTRTNELVVTRAAGVSVWQFLMPGIAIALLLGTFFVAIINPVAAATISRFDRIEGKYLGNATSTLSISPSGLWLRQVNEKGIDFRGVPVDEYILHALRMQQSTLTLQHVIIFLYQREQFVGRIDADNAVLSAGKWMVHGAVLSAPGAEPERIAQFEMPTQLTMNQIEDSFSAPETFSFWTLPGFIQVLEKAGFSALRHKLHFHSLVALPVLLAGMLMLAAVFTLRQPRKGRTGILVIAGVVVGFLFYFATNLIYALGSSGHLPIILAAWAPSLLVVMFAAAALLHLEDG